MKKTFLFFVCLTLTNIILFSKAYAYDLPRYGIYDNDRPSSSAYIGCDGAFTSIVGMCRKFTKEEACAQHASRTYVNTGGTACLNQYEYDANPASSDDWKIVDNPDTSGCENGSVTGTSCTCNSGFYDTGTSCSSEEPPPPPEDCSSKAGKTIIRYYTAAENCGSVPNDLTGCDIRTPPTFDCVDSCQYNFASPAVIHSCGSSDSDNRATRYCAADFVGTGTACGSATITAGSSSSNTPESTTPHQTSANNSGGSSNSNHNSSNPSSGGSGTSGTSGNGGKPSGDSNSNNNNPPPPPPPPDVDITIKNAGDVDCPDCATETTQVEVLKALTNTQGGTDQPNVESQGFGAGDIADLMVSDNRIQSLFKFIMPSHSRICPTADIDLRFDALNLGLHKLESHCLLLEPKYNVLRGIALVAWLIFAMVILLKG